MKAGQAIIFSSANLHGSFPNISEDDRFALVGRYCNNSVKLYKDMTFDHFSTTKGLIKFSTDKLESLQVHGIDNYKHNKIANV